MMCQFLAQMSNTTLIKRCLLYLNTVKDMETTATANRPPSMAFFWPGQGWYFMSVSGISALSCWTNSGERLHTTMLSQFALHHCLSCDSNTSHIWIIALYRLVDSSSVGKISQNQNKERTLKMSGIARFERLEIVSSLYLVIFALIPSKCSRLFSLLAK